MFSLGLRILAFTKTLPKNSLLGFELKEKSNRDIDYLILAILGVAVFSNSWFLRLWSYGNKKKLQFKFKGRLSLGSSTLFVLLFIN